ncbi:MAG: hypothetical protein ACKO22_07315 [Cyanobium sp.]
MDLQQRYGCVAGVPGEAFAGRHSISRFEAAPCCWLACGPGWTGCLVSPADSDQISVTPAIFYLSAPLGQLQKGEGRSFDNVGALIKTSFRF